MSRIRFEHSKSKDIMLDPGINGLKLLPAIFALKETGSYSYGSDRMTFNLATDAEGARNLQSKASDAVEAISDMIQLISKLMGHADSDWLNTDDLKACAFMLGGLSELQQLVIDARESFGMAANVGEVKSCQA